MRQKEYIHRDGTKFSFFINEYGTMSVKIFRKIYDQDDPIVEDNKIFIETANIHQLMRGIQQRTFTVGNLNERQKNQILDTIDC